MIMTMDKLADCSDILINTVFGKEALCGLDSYSKKQNKNLQESHKTEEFDLGPTGKKSIFMNISAMIIYVEDNPGVAQMP